MIFIYLVVFYLNYKPKLASRRAYNLSHATVLHYLN
jgi:hypothetical protein